tara:strand:- start:4347 stop:5255 length:909 start_codon:yes stop_codon:yes gene_type:complete
MATYDIVRDYAWTTASQAERANAPYVDVSGCRLDGSNLQQAIQGYLAFSGADEPGKDFIKSLYKCDPSSEKQNFTFPFFGTNIRSFANEYADTFSNIAQRGTEFPGKPLIDAVRTGADWAIGGQEAITKLIDDDWFKKGVETYNEFAGKIGFNISIPEANSPGAPGTYIESPMFYQYGNTDAALQVSFVLSNTYDEASTRKNIDFINDFTRFNRPERLGAINLSYPMVYNVVLPGWRKIVWAYISGFSINFLGARRILDTYDMQGGGGPTIVPEAFQCDFAFKSLTIENAEMVEPTDAANVG